MLKEWVGDVKKPKFVLLATLSSFIIPVVFAVWFYLTYDFLNPDGTVDNGPIRAVPIILIFLAIVFVFEAFIYGFLGLKQYSSEKQSLAWGLFVTTLLAFLLFLMFIPAIYQSIPNHESLGFTVWLEITLLLFVVPWCSFFTGVYVQYYLIGRYRRELEKVKNEI